MIPRILVVYGTTDGQTRKIAAAMAGALHADGARVDVVEARSDARAIAPGQYDAVIVAASVHAGSYQRGVRRWVAANVSTLRTVPTAFVSVCLGILEHNPKTDARLNELIDRFLTMTAWQPGVRKIVAGALLYRKYNWLKRFAMRRIAAKAGGDVDTSRDHEYTDWEDLKTFAVRFNRDFVMREQRQTG